MFVDVHLSDTQIISVFLIDNKPMLMPNVITMLKWFAWFPIYSVVMNIADVANNSRNARRFVLYDNSSQISLDEERPLFVSSAVAETGYSWQTPSKNASR